MLQVLNLYLQFDFLALALFERFDGALVEALQHLVLPFPLLVESMEFLVQFVGEVLHVHHFVLDDFLRTAGMGIEGKFAHSNDLPTHPYLVFVANVVEHFRQPLVLGLQFPDAVAHLVVLIQRKPCLGEAGYVNKFYHRSNLLLSWLFFNLHRRKRERNAGNVAKSINYAHVLEILA